MIQHITQFKEASLALEHWRFVDSQQRSEYLLTFQSQLAQKQPALAAIMAMQVAASRELIDKTTPL
ncbi:hypothetical protein ACPV5V_23960, partial [Vibrio campbellii]